MVESGIAFKSVKNNDTISLESGVYATFPKFSKRASFNESVEEYRLIAIDQKVEKYDPCDMSTYANQLSTRMGYVGLLRDDVLQRECSGIPNYEMTSTDTMALVAQKLGFDGFICLEYR